MNDPTAEAASSTFDAALLIGVHGWLKWLCIIMTVITPILVLVSVGGDLSAMATVPQPERPWVITCDVLQLLAGASCVYAGIRLWQVRPNAPFLAQMALGLVAFTDFGIAAACSWNFPNYQWDSTASARGLVSTLIWVAYLNQSKRVKNTFKDA